MKQFAAIENISN